MVRGSQGARKEEHTPYACVRDVAASWQRYERIAEAMTEPAPAGLVVHVAGPTDEGFRTIDVWESEQAWDSFRSSRLESAMADLAGSIRLQSTFRDLRPIHIVLGAKVGVVARESNEARSEEQ
jgi:hypothetical protein